MAYYNQVRFTKRVGLWLDEQLRTNENFVDGISQNILRLGAIYYLNNNAKITAGYAFVSNFFNSKGIPSKTNEHRPWQQFQWERKFNKNNFSHSIRTEERFREQYDSYFFNFRVRNNFSFSTVIINSFTKHPISFVANDEIHISFGKGFEKNILDQNRFFCGLGIKLSSQNNLQLGYLNVWQNISEGVIFRNINAPRISFLQNIDLRKR